MWAYTIKATHYTQVWAHTIKKNKNKSLEKRAQTCRLDQKTGIIYLLSPRNRCHTKVRCHLRVKEWKKFHVNGSRKQAGVTFSAADNTDFQPKLVRKYTDNHFILTKE